MSARLALVACALAFATAAGAAEPEKPPPPFGTPGAPTATERPRRTGPERPFAQGGLFEIPEGKDVRMGDPSGGLSIVAEGGSAIQKQGLALALQEGKMGVGLSAGGGRGIRIVAGKVTIETLGGKFSVERDDELIRVNALEGKVTVSGAGAPRVLSAWQRLDVPAGGQPKLGGVAAADHKRDVAWIGEVKPAPAPAAPARPARKKRGR